MTVSRNTATATRIRRVNGWGARCGCGGASVVHLRDVHAGLRLHPDTSTFLCQECAMTAFATFLADRDLPPYWPGDEDRDEPYVDPRKECE